MPWKVFKNGDKFCVHQMSGEEKGERVACHDTEQAASGQMAALYASERKARAVAVKMVEGSEDMIEGLLLPYGGPLNGRDVYGEYFSSRTDFCRSWYPGELPLLYHHGLDSDLGVDVIGRIKSVEMRPEGGWMQAQLDKSAKYHAEIKKLIEQGALGLSSGAMAHLVHVDGKTGEILRWPLVEGSATPTEANPFARVSMMQAANHYRTAGLDLPESLRAELSTDSRNELSDADFAYIDSGGGRHLPINDEAHVRNAIARFVQTQFESDEAKAMARQKILARAKELGVEVSDDSMKAVSMERMKEMASEMEMELSDAEMARMMEGAEEMSEADMKKRLQQHQHGRASKSASLKAISWEDIRSECSRMLQQMMDAASPFREPGYCYVEETYSDHVIASVSHEGQERHYSVPFALGADGHVASMGKPEEVEETYVPKKPAMPPDLPMAMAADMTRAYAADLSERTRDLAQRRLKEGRMLSTTNRRKLQECLESMGVAMKELQALLDSSEPQTAKAASLRRLRAQLVAQQMQALSLN